MHTLFPAVKAIIQQNNTFLILKQEFQGRYVWDLPGGKVDFGENPYDALKREVVEETNLQIRIVKPLGLFWFFDYKENQVVCSTFLCEAISEQLDITMNPAQEDITAFRWVTKEEFLDEAYIVGHESLKQLVSQQL